VRDRPRRPACSDHEGALSDRRDPLVVQRSQEAVAVGGVADERPVGVHDGVDGAERGRLGRQVVARRGCIRLVRHGDVQAREAERRDGPHRSCTVTASDGERDVHPVEPEGIERGVVHRR
jgi:hypothetical protein